MGVDRESICNTWDIHTAKNSLLIISDSYCILFCIYYISAMLGGSLEVQNRAAHAVQRSSPAHSSILVLACELRIDFTSVNVCKKKQQRREKVVEEEREKEEEGERQETIYLHL